MAEHAATVTVNAPVQQVYALFSHFNDFPKFMTFVKEVTYQDSQNSHWVADIVGRHEWDAVNENWIPGQQIGWRSTDGLENSGRVTFSPLGETQTGVNVLVSYNPPAGFLGDIAEVLGSGKHFETALQHDLDNFARMVAEAPPGALDPMSSSYLFHEDSAAAKGQTTVRQDDTMTEANTGVQSPAEGASWQGSSIGTSPDSASGYNTDTTEANPDSAPTTGTASWGGDAMARGTGTTAGSAAAVANQNNPVTPERKEEASGAQSEESRSLDSDI